MKLNSASTTVFLLAAIILAAMWRSGRLQTILGVAYGK